jgi:aminopeptidase-like protein
MKTSLDRYFELLTALWPLHRTLVSDDTDRAVEMIQAFLRDVLGVPGEQVRIHEFASGTELSTWVVPKKYTLRGFGLRQVGPAPRTVLGGSEISLSVAEYSQPVDRELEWDELQEHLFFSERRPQAVPFVFKYFYRKNWGFCLPKTVHDGLDRKGRYHARIESELTDSTLKCLEVVLPGKTDDSLLVMSNICHPHQVNDSITGAINALLLVEHFLAAPHHHTLRFGFWPETIGAMAYFTHYRAERDRFKAAVFTEMLGTEGIHALQLSRQETTPIDRAARYALTTLHGLQFRSGRYTTVLRNDERISNGINLDIPTISLSRYPYPEYHTSDDSPSIVDMKRLEESFRVTRDLLSVVDQDETLRPADFLFGQPFLTRYDLFHDPPAAGGSAKRDLNKMMEDVFSYSDGRTSLLEIADRFGYRWEDVQFLSRGLLKHGLFESEREGS